MSLLEAVNRLTDFQDHETSVFDGLLQRFESLTNHQKALHYKFDFFLQANLERWRRRASSPDSGYNLLFYTYGQSSEGPNYPDLIGLLSWQVLLDKHWLDVIKCQIIRAADGDTAETIYVAGLSALDNSIRMKPYILRGKPNPQEVIIDLPGSGFGQLALQAGILPYSDLPPSLDIPLVMQRVINLAKTGNVVDIREVLGI